MGFNALPVRCWVSPEGEFHSLPLAHDTDVYADWSNRNIASTGIRSGTPEDFVNSGWLMVCWQKITCAEGAADNAIHIAHGSGVFGKWYTIKVLMKNGAVSVGSIKAGCPSSSPVWWESRN